MVLLAPSLLLQPTHRAALHTGAGAPEALATLAGKLCFVEHFSVLVVFLWSMDLVVIPVFFEDLYVK
jgi:hypothetical protein